MQTITKEELKAKMESGEPFKLVMALGELAYMAKHIPGSLHTSTPDALHKMLDKSEDIVVYCSNPSCIVSVAVYRYLKSSGYEHVRRYAGGLEEREAAGYPMGGDMVGAEMEDR